MWGDAPRASAGLAFGRPGGDKRPAVTPTDSAAALPPAPPPALTADPATRLRADGVLALITVFWGVTFVVVKDALADGDPFTFLALRFLVGALALTAVVRGALLGRAVWRRGVPLGVLLFLGFALQTVGLTRTTPSRSAFLTGLYVVIVPLLSVVLFRRVPRVASLVGVGLAAAGLWGLTGASAGGLGLGLGEVLTLGCAVAYALHIQLTERWAPREGAMALVGAQLWVVALLSAACLPFAGVRVTFTPGFVGAVLVCGLLASALAISLQTWAQARTTAVRAVLLYSLEPVFAAGYSVALGHERLGAREWAGGTLIVLGVLVAELGGMLWARWRRAD